MYRSFSENTRDRNSRRYRRVASRVAAPTAIPCRSTTWRTNWRRSSPPGDSMAAARSAARPSMTCTSGTRADAATAPGVARGHRVNLVPYSIRLTTESSSPVAMRPRMPASRCFSHADQFVSAAAPVQSRRAAGTLSPNAARTGRASASVIVRTTRSPGRAAAMAAALTMSSNTKTRPPRGQSGMAAVWDIWGLPGPVAVRAVISAEY